MTAIRRAGIAALQDVRATSLYGQVETLFRDLHRPGSGAICDAGDLQVSKNGESVLFTGTLAETIHGPLRTSIRLLHLAHGEALALAPGLSSSRCARFAPDARSVAFIAGESGESQLWLVDLSGGDLRRISDVPGCVENLQWSPDGRRILFGVAGYGVDLASGLGATTLRERSGERPSWLPEIQASDQTPPRRDAWIHDMRSGGSMRIEVASNLWDAAWCGDDRIAAIASPGGAEGDWYGATLHLIDIASGEMRELYRGEAQLGLLAGAPSGARLAFVEGLCSDRGIVAGDLRLLDTVTGHVELLDTQGVDVTHIEWRSENLLLLAGHRGLETVVASLDIFTAQFQEIWSSVTVTTAGRYATVSGFGDRGDCAFIAEGFDRAPQLAIIRGGQWEAGRSFTTPTPGGVVGADCAAIVRWHAPDGLMMEGWLLRPEREPPHPMVMLLHGGPVFHWRTTWLGRGMMAAALALLKRGYGVFLPNPRGSSGRGQDFARLVRGDMGGADCDDLMTGLDMLVERGLADPRRLGVTGKSYGGYLSSWLVTQHRRFAAAAPVAAVSNRVSAQLLSNIPQFTATYLGDDYDNPAGKHFSRSPVMFAKAVTTPVLNICGRLDRCTPPEEGLQFHNALCQAGARSVLVTYPEEGHGVSRVQAVMDYATRLVGWFEEHMPA